MKNIKLISKIFVVSFALLLGACASGYQSYQRGNYYKACEEAVERLRSNASQKKAQEALQNAYPLAQEALQRDVSRALDSRDLNSYDQAIALYERMNKLANDIIHSPGALAIVPNPREYNVELRELKAYVAEESYKEGLRALDYGTLEQARVAFDNFNRTNRYVPGYKDVRNKIEEARYMATMRVIVMKPLTNSRYQLDADFFYNKLMSDITRNTYSRLVKFYTPEEATAQRMRDPHQLLVLDFADFTVGNTREISNTTDIKRDSVLVGTANGANVYATVKAKYTTTKMEIVSSGVLTMRVIDAKTDRVLNQKNFSGTSVWKTEWATFRGDERALSSVQRALVGRRPLPVPPPQELFASFASPLYSQATGYISYTY